MSLFPADLISRLERTRVVAGFTVTTVEQAVPVARALLAGGIDVIELTLRSPVAMDAARLIHEEVPEMVLGIGTILTPNSVKDAKAAGAAFGVSPGLNEKVVRAAHKLGLPFAPGICTPSDLEAAIELDCRLVKFFPAEGSGGVDYLRSMGAPYSHLGIQYFPLGGLNSENMMSYLNEPNVPAIGGSWIVTREILENSDWPELTKRAATVRNAVQSL